ncbi:MAG: hypothetical protein IPK26_21755 [Planctomycetes bacterium]|nr:hypothetical protein [Planctomycetota bacterium]
MRFMALPRVTFLLSLWSCSLEPADALAQARSGGQEVTGGEAYRAEMLSQLRRRQELGPSDKNQLLKRIGDMGAAGASLADELLEWLTEARAKSSSELGQPEQAAIVMTLADIVHPSGGLPLDACARVSGAVRSTMLFIAIRRSAADTEPNVEFDEVDLAGACDRFEYRQERADQVRCMSVAGLAAALGCGRAYDVEMALDECRARGASVPAALPALEPLLTRRDPRILGTTISLGIRRKTALAVVSVAPMSTIATQARQVLAEVVVGGVGAKAKIELHRGTLSDLGDALKRAAARKTIRDMGPQGVALILAELRRDPRSLFVIEALQLLDRMVETSEYIGELLEIVPLLPEEQIPGALMLVRQAAFRSWDVLGPLYACEWRGRGWLMNREVAVAGSAGWLGVCVAVNAVREARRVNQALAIGDLEELLAAPCVLRREAALCVLQTRGLEAKPALASVAQLLQQRQPMYEFRPLTPRRRGTDAPLERFPVEVDRTLIVAQLAAKTIVACGKEGNEWYAEALALLQAEGDDRR